MIYLDNAATSWPKPDGVIKAMERALLGFSSNPGRGVHKGALGAERIVSHTRELLAQLFNIQDPSRIVFAANATHALNQAIQGSLKPGDQVITTTMEHNSVWRPLKYLERKGVELKAVRCDEFGQISPAEIERNIQSNTSLIVTTHASNVTGTVQPVKEIGKIARKHGITYLLDASQTAGVLPIDVVELNVDLMAFPGHKGLLGPQGTGGLYIRAGAELEPLIQGGTGGNSELEFQPEILPGKYESGTLNTVGIAGLGAAVEYLLAQDQAEIMQKETYLCESLIKGVSEIDKVKIYGPPDRKGMAPVVSINLAGVESNEVGYILDRAFQIAVRSGLHCAPQAHATIGTSEQGTVRFSPSSFNSEQDVLSAITALKEIAREF